MARRANLYNYCRLLVLLALSALPLAVFSAKLPSYLKPCSRSDPNINECARKSGQEGIPHFINGDRKFKLPPLNPLEIIAISVNQGTAQVGLQIHLQNCRLYGLKDTIIQNIDIDLPNKQFTWHLNTPRVEVLSHYNVTGRILLLPIFGAGNANITMENPTYKYVWKYTIEKRNGVEYIVPKKGVVTYKLDKVHIKLENLFNGDSLLGPQMNKFLNENWEDASRELGPSLAEALSRVIDNIIRGICQTVPYDDIFTP